MKRASEEDSVLDIVLGYLGWLRTDPHLRYHVLRFLRLCRGEEVPSFDDFCAQRQRAG